MNVAFSAALTFLLLIPGLIYLRVRRATGEYSHLIVQPPEPFSIEIATAIIAAVIIHALTCGVAEACSGMFSTPRVDFRAVLMLLLGRFGDKDAYLGDAVSSVTNYPLSILIYMTITIAVAGALGAGSHNLVPKCLQPFMCFGDDRDSIVSEWKTFFNLKPNKAALVTAVVEMGGTSYLFLGVLRRLHFNSKTAELERIQLANVAKCKLEDADVPADQNPPFKEVFGHQFVLRMSEVKTLNVIYVDQQLADGATTLPPSA